MTDRELLGARLREAREYLGYSQSEVADALGLKRSAISLIESGKRKVDALELAHLARLYQYPVAYFMEESDASVSEPSVVQHLARAATLLTDNDQAELLRFAHFLSAKATVEEG